MNELFVNKRVWKAMSEDELEEYKQALFDYYKNERGFPYFDLSDQQIEKEVQKMIDFDSSTLEKEDDVISQNMKGLNLVNHFMPHMWHTKCHHFSTPYEAFADDDTFRKVIEKRLKMGDNMSDAGIRKTLTWISGTHRVSNFRPTVAKYIYDKYAGEGKVLDLSCGYGGRLFGAISSDRVKVYHGAEPQVDTFNGLFKISALDKTGTKISIANSPIEDCEYVFDKDSYDLVFTSPPYFNTEEYSYDPNQSFMRYPEKEMWKEKFLKRIINLSYQWLKDDGLFALNIANVKTCNNLEESALKYAEETGFKLIKTHKMALSGLMRGGYKYEPIFIFKK